MEKNTDDINILDIHTHKTESATDGTSIINYPLSTDSPSPLPPVKDYLYSVGVHPWKLTERGADRQLGLIKKLTLRKQFVAIGEVGLDKLATAPMELQTKIFKEQVRLSEERKLPLIIHCVKAMEELLAVKKEFSPEQPWIWHGFRGNPEQAAQLLKKGFYLSFGEHYPDKTLISVPAGRLFLETDTATADINDILSLAAKTRGVEVDALRDVVHENARKVFFNG